MLRNVVTLVALSSAGSQLMRTGLYDPMLELVCVTTIGRWGNPNVGVGGKTPKFV